MELEGCITPAATHVLPETAIFSEKRFFHILLIKAGASGWGIKYAPEASFSLFKEREWERDLTYCYGICWSSTMVAADTAKHCRHGHQIHSSSAYSYKTTSKHPNKSSDTCWLTFSAMRFGSICIVCHLHVPLLCGGVHGMEMPEPHQDCISKGFSSWHWLVI